MKKATEILRVFCCICLSCVVILAFITIVGCGGGDGGDGGDGGGALDSDGDGISNDLELNGYTYDYVTDTYSLWDGDISKEYFKSDPLQWSTDGDPYPDSMEVSGLLMDRSVLAPGNHPMITAYPNLIVKMIAYAVTPNHDITDNEGVVREQGQTWKVEQLKTTSITRESHWENSGKVSFSISDFEVGGSVTTGASKANTSTIGTVRSNGGNIMYSNHWSMATTSNPSEAAKIELTLEAMNVGTSVAKDIILSMNLVIGGKPVSTIENVEIPVLEVGHKYICSVPSSSKPDIILTYNELRSLETGASVSIEVTNLSAGVVRKNGDLWEKIGTWDDYIREADAVSAHIFLDLGDGKTTEHLIAAYDSESSPVVTLKDAIIWAANGHEHPTLGPVVRFYQTDGTLGDPQPLKDWYFSLDASTYDSISGYIQNPEFNLFDTILKPYSIIVAKAPPIEDTPNIRWAAMSNKNAKVTAYVDDYFFSQNLLEVYYVDQYNWEHKMEWDAEMLHFSYDWYGLERKYNEKIVARNAFYDPNDPATFKWESELFIPPEWNNNKYVFYDTYAEDVFVVGNYAYVMGPDGLLVIDVSDIENLKLPGSYDIIDTSVHEKCVFVDGSYAYVAWSDGLLVIDVSDPTNPTLAGSYDINWMSNNIFVDGSYAYVARGNGLMVFNVSDPEKITIAGTYSSSSPEFDSLDLYLAGDYAYVIGMDELLVIDVSDPTNLTLAGSYDIEGSYSSGVFVKGDYAYVTGQDGLLVIDVGDPTNISMAGSYESWSVSAPFVFRDYAYLLAGRKLQVIDVSDPENLTLAGEYNTPGADRSVFVTDDYTAYVANTDGLHIIRF